KSPQEEDAMKRAKKPYVVCHMVPSVDGRIVTTRWKLSPRMLAEYEKTAQTFDANAWMIGRISMEPYAGKAQIPKAKGAKSMPKTDFFAQRDPSSSYAIALDPSGKLAWRSSDAGGDHAVAVLSEKVSSNYLAFLRSKGVSYLFGGKTEIDLERVLETLRR